MSTAEDTRVAKRAAKILRKRQKESARLAKYRARAAEKPLPKIMQGNRRRAFLAAISCTIVFVAVVICVVDCLITQPSDVHPERGIYTFRLFTVFSNLVSAFACFVSIPFAIEGVRKNSYSIPEWVVTIHYMGATSVCITLIFAICLILPFAGSYLAFGGPNFFMHLVCPVLCICAFLFLQSSHTMRAPHAFISLLPFFGYAVVYFINVVVNGDTSGWRDIYQLNTRVSVVISLPAMLLFAWCVSRTLGTLHNVISARQAAIDERLALAFAPATDEDTLDGQVQKLAERMAARQRAAGGESGYLLIPKVMLEDLNDEFDNEHTMDNLCRLYLDYYLDAMREKADTAEAAVPTPGVFAEA